MLRYNGAMPLVSVIIPTYNRAEQLDRAVKSVFNQTFKDFELIVVDDGSTDNSAETLNRYDGLVRCIRQENRGVSSARNLGISDARGDILAFLDSDDEWLPEKLARQLELLRESNPFFICHTDEVWIRDGARIPQKKQHRKQGGRFFPRALRLCLISPSSVIITRCLLDRVGWFDEDLIAAEDYDLWLRITAFHHVDFVPKPLVIKHGGHPDQLSRTVPSIDRFRIKAIEKTLANPELNPDHREAAIMELMRKCEIFASGCYKRGKKTEAKHYRELARSYAPG
ncbi:glycosyltransferase family 2 protein [Thermodesulfobacteriota bacterium]